MLECDSWQKMKSVETQNLYGLSVQTVEKIRTVFKRYPKIEQVIVYGSRAKGNAETGSDVDLAIIGAEFTDRQLTQVEIELDQLMLPYMFDISRFQGIRNPDLISHIKRVGKVFYERGY